MDQVGRETNGPAPVTIAEVVERVAACEILTVLNSHGPRVNGRVIYMWLEKVALRPRDFDELVSTLERDGLIAVERDEHIVLQLCEKGYSVISGATRHPAVAPRPLPR